MSVLLVTRHDNVCEVAGTILRVEFADLHNLPGILNPLMRAKLNSTIILAENVGLDPSNTGVIYGFESQLSGYCGVTEVGQEVNPHEKLNSDLHEDFGLQPPFGEKVADRSGFLIKDSAEVRVQIARYVAECFEEDKGRIARLKAFVGDFFI